MQLLQHSHLCFGAMLVRNLSAITKCNSHSGTPTPSCIHIFIFLVIPCSSEASCGSYPSLLQLQWICVITALCIDCDINITATFYSCPPPRTEQLCFYPCLCVFIFMQHLQNIIRTSKKKSKKFSERNLDCTSITDQFNSQLRNLRKDKNLLEHFHFHKYTWFLLIRAHCLSHDSSGGNPGSGGAGRSRSLTFWKKMKIGPHNK